MTGASMRPQTKLRWIATAYMLCCQLIVPSARLPPQETACWPLMLQLAALRFWVSRQQYAIAHKGQPEVLINDPTYFRQLLMLHVKQQ